MATTVKPPKQKAWSKQTPEWRDSFIRSVVSLYNTIYKGSGLTYKVPDDYVQFCYKYGTNRIMLEQYLKEKEPKKYLKSETARDRMKLLRDQLIAIFPTDMNLKADKELTKMLEDWALGKPDALLGRFIATHITKTTAWRNLSDSKYFSTWVTANGITDFGDFAAIWEKYTGELNTLRDDLSASWKNTFGTASEVPESALMQALSGRWTSSSPQWLELITKDPNFVNTEFAKTRDVEFTENWESLFGSSVPVDSVIMAKWRLAGDMTWDKFFTMYIKPLQVFRDAFPGYEAWETLQHQKGNLEGSDAASISSYLQARQVYIDDYKNTYGVDKEPEAGLIDKALAGDWSQAQFHNFIMENDPNRFTSPEYIAKIDQFNNYWQGMMGDGSTPDPGLAAQFAASGSSDPSSMWNAIKNSGEFQSRFPNWNAFSTAQTAAGVDVTENPLLYNQYKTAFERAFQQVGMPVPTGYERQFFASGIDPGDLERNVQDYSDTAQSYQWVTGQQADVATAAGIANKTAGGALKQRMQAALDQQRKYAGSSYNEFERGRAQTGELTRKI